MILSCVRYYHSTLGGNAAISTSSRQPIFYPFNPNPDLHSNCKTGKLQVVSNYSDSIVMKHALTLLIAVFVIASPAAAAAERTPAQKQTMEKEAQQIAQELVSKLGAALKQALAESGPEGAISVCRDTAPMLANSLSRRTGWKVGRVSLQARNPLIGQPDAWEQDVLRRFDEEAASGADPVKLHAAEIVSEPQAEYFRFMKALPVKPLCLTCHGNEQTIPASVQARLAQEYPNDTATGYSTGQIRGAVSIKRRLEPTN
jgi:hypothetical protein